MEHIVAEDAPAALFERRDDPDAREVLATRYMGLAESLARRYRYSGQPIDDLTQVACVGLMKAIDRFDPGRGLSFESYAVPTIIGELKRHHRDRGWCIRVPRHIQENSLAVKAAIPDLAQQLKRSPTIREIGDHAGLSEEDVLEALEAQDAYSSMSLDAPIGTSEPGESVTLGDVLADEADDFEVVETWAECLPHIRALPDRERRLIELRYFQDRTQSEIAKQLGISQMHVSRLLSQTLSALRDAVGAA